MLMKRQLKLESKLAMAINKDMALEMRVLIWNWENLSLGCVTAAAAVFITHIANPIREVYISQCYGEEIKI